MLRKAIFILWICLLSIAVFADNKPTNDTTAAHTDMSVFTDDPIVQMLDSMINLSYFQKHQPLYEFMEDNPYGFDTGDIPYYSDSIIALQMELFNTTTPFHLTHNAQVQKYIDFYAYRRRASVARMLGMGRLYFPLFEEMLDKYNLPMELKYLAIVESALNPVAVSRAGAVGLWQFMPATGRIYGLNPGHTVDDRRDPYKATDAACRHFVDLYNRFGDWNLVLAAYNAGSGGVLRAIKRAGGATDYWEVQPYLPRETQNYVPAFIGVTYVMSHHKEFNIYPETPPFHYYELDTVAVTGSLTLDYLAEKLQIDKDDLAFLNPALKAGKIQGSPESPWYLTLPRTQAGIFISNADSLYQDIRETGAVKTSSPGHTISPSGNVHVVRRGESLGIIATRNGCSVNALKKQNNLKSNMIHPGQKLYIP